VLAVSCFAEGTVAFSWRYRDLLEEPCLAEGTVALLMSAVTCFDEYSDLIEGSHDLLRRYRDLVKIAVVFTRRCRDLVKGAAVLSERGRSYLLAARGIC